MLGEIRCQSLLDVKGLFAYSQSCCFVFSGCYSAEWHSSFSSHSRTHESIPGHWETQLGQGKTANGNKQKQKNKKIQSKKMAKQNNEQIQL